MSNESAARNKTEQNNKKAVNRDSVSEYLLKNPSFLIDNPDLLIQLQLNLQENGVVSLSEIQASQSRAKIKKLDGQLSALKQTAQTNQLIYSTYAELNLDLAKAGSLEELEQAIKTRLVEQLGLETAKLIILSESSLETEKALSEIQQRSIFDKKFAKQAYFFGRISNLDKEALFTDASAASVALVRLNDVEAPHADIGLLAVSSSDAQHFHPDMDTVLIEFLRNALNFHIARLM